MRGRLESGISELDSMLGGGLIDRSLYALVLDSVIEGRTLCREILYNHVLRGGKVAYYILESSPEDIVESLSFYGWRIDEHIDRGLWRFISIEYSTLRDIHVDFPQPRCESLVIDGLDALAKDAISSIRGGAWCFVEFSFLANRYELDELVKFLLYVKRGVRTYGGIYFIELAGKLVDSRRLNLMKHLADCVFEIQGEETELEPRGVLLVRKFGEKPEGIKVIPFTIRDTGVVVHTLQRVA